MGEMAPRSGWLHEFHEVLCGPEDRIVLGGHRTRKRSFQNLSRDSQGLSRRAKFPEELKEAV
jgi:hypothetical protein